MGTNLRFSPISDAAAIAAALYTPGRMKRGRETFLAVLVGAAASAVYLPTMYPGLVGTGDTPELQFVGRVLGTAHTPGYPLYVLVSWAFSHVPVGSVAYRINLMSVVFGALTAGLSFLLLRRLACRASVAAATALALAYGRVFWSQATIAEVYTLAAALLAGVLVALAAWEETRSEAALLVAFALAALGLGHHYTDVVTVAPALVLYAVTSPARASLGPGVLLRGLALLMLGVAQYGFILLRTRQRAPYLGAQASSLTELASVMRGGRFGSRLFVFDLRTILLDRLPAFGRALAEEVGPAGLALLLLGLLVLLRHRPRLAVLLALGAAGPAFFALNYDVPDVAVFLLPSFLLLWPLAGVGLEALLSALPATTPPAVTGALALLLPAAQLVANYRSNDHHTRTFETRYFRALVESLPSRCAIVSESYTVDQMLRYELLGEGVAATKEVALSGRDTDSVEAFRRKGYAVFAFERGRRDLAPLGYRFAPVTLPDAPLADALLRQPAGSAVLLAGPLAGEGAALRAIGGGAPGAGVCAAIGIAGAVRGALVRCDGGAVELEVAAGGAIGETGAVAPARLHVASRRAGALVEVDGRTAARAETGLAVAVVHPTGRVLERYAGDARVPFSRRAFPFDRMTGGPDCTDAGNVGWVDATAAASGGRVLGRIDDFRPFDASLVLYLARNHPLAPRLAETQGRGAPRLEVRAFEAGDPALPRALDADGLGRDLARFRFVSRVEVRVNDEGEFSAFAIDLGGVPAKALARGRVDRDNPKRAQVCALPAGGAELLADPPEPRGRIPFGTEGAAYFGYGWHPPERDGPVDFRWTAETEAELLVPLARVGGTRLRLQAMPPEAGPPAALELRVNGTAVEPRPLRPGWSVYEWTLPASAWRRGPNQVLVRSSSVRRAGADPRTLGVAVSHFHLEALADGAADDGPADRP